MGAKVSTLNKLHEALADYFIKRIGLSTPKDDAPVEYDDETGEELPPFFIPLSASELQVMVTFLSNNKISATPDDEKMAELTKEFEKELETARASKANDIISKVHENDAVLHNYLN